VYRPPFLHRTSCPSVCGAIQKLLFNTGKCGGTTYWYVIMVRPASRRGGVGGGGGGSTYQTPGPGSASILFFTSSVNLKIYSVMNIAQTNIYRLTDRTLSLIFVRHCYLSASSSRSGAGWWCDSWTGAFVYNSCIG
jgi:hypothetical protein